MRKSNQVQWHIYTENLVDYSFEGSGSRGCAFDGPAKTTTSYTSIHNFWNAPFKSKNGLCHAVSVIRIIIPISFPTTPK